MLKREREILHACKQANAKVLSTDLAGSGKYKVTLQAPNGAQKPFFFSRDPGARQAINEEKAVEHWVQENMPTPMALAVAKAGLQLPDGQSDHKIVAAVKEASRPLSTMTVAEVRNSVIPQPETKETLMDTKTTTAKATREVLSQAKFYKLCEYIKENVPEGTKTTYKELAANISKNPAMFNVSDHAVKNALETIGRKIDTPFAKGSGHGKSTQILARTLCDLLSSLGHGIPTELKALCGEDRS